MKIGKEDITKNWIVGLMYRERKNVLLGNVLLCNEDVSEADLHF